MVNTKETQKSEHHKMRKKPEQEMGKERGKQGELQGNDLFEDFQVMGRIKSQRFTSKAQILKLKTRKPGHC
jgi:hypothetical protein